MLIYLFSQSIDFFQILHFSVFQEVLLIVVFEELNGLSQSGIRLAAGRVLMAAAVENIMGKHIDRTVALRAERHLDLIHVFTHENGVLDRADLQRHIDYSLRVARLEIEALELLPGDGYQRGMIFGEDTHLVVDAIAGETQTIDGKLIENRVENLVFVDARTEQFGYHHIELGVVAVEGEIAGIGHEAGVEASGSGQR